MQSWNFIVCNCCVRADYVSGNGFRDDVSGIFIVTLWTSIACEKRVKSGKNRSVCTALCCGCLCDNI